jgi:hypothetical protein
MVASLPLRIMSVLLLLGLLPDAFARDTSIRINLEEPVVGESYSGISNLRGWAVAPNGISKVEVFVDGVFVFEVPMGGQRTDVGNVFPTYPGSSSSGFSMAYNYKNLQPGSHSMLIRAFDSAGNFNEDEAVFSTERFVSTFINTDASIDLSTTSAVQVKDKQTFIVRGATVEGESWDFALKWDRASQALKIQDIQKVQESSGDIDGSGSGSSGQTGGSDGGSGGSNGTDSNDVATFDDAKWDEAKYE